MIIKEIIYDTDTGLLRLRDNKGSQYQCNIYGHKQIKFHPKLSGIASATERRTLSKDFNLTIPSLLPQGIDYFPISNKLECYSQFPRPLVRPMSNIDYSKRNERLRNELVNILQLNYSSHKAKHFFNNEEDTLSLSSTRVNTLSYSTCKLSNEQRYLIDTKKILELIENTFNSMFDKKTDWEIDIIKHQVKYKALKQLKLFLKANNYDINIYHYGIKLNEPSNRVKTLYSSIHNSINKSGRNPAKPIKGIPPRLMAYRPTTATTTMHNQNRLYTDLSFLSQSSDDKANLFIDNDTEDKKVKTKRQIQCITELEEKYIKGYQPPVIKQKPIIRRDNNLKLKTNLDLYLKDCEVEAKVNPTVKKIQMKKQRYEDELLIRKRNQTRIRLKGQGYIQ